MDQASTGGQASDAPRYDFRAAEPRWQAAWNERRCFTVADVPAEGDRYEFETDFIIRAAHAGYTFTNIPISTIYGPQSYFRAFHDAMLVIKVLWKHRSGIFRRAPKRPLPSAG